jgi:hypothetical protein
LREERKAPIAHIHFEEPPKLKRMGKWAALLPRRKSQMKGAYYTKILTFPFGQLGRPQICFALAFERDPEQDVKTRRANHI